VHRDIAAIFDVLFAEMHGHSVVASLLKESTKVTFVTVCSGIDSPVQALRMLHEAANRKRSGFVKFEHLYACEIEPWKQIFLERNSNPKYIFRDVIELSKPGATHA
jgi:hypothetical protein